MKEPKIGGRSPGLGKTANYRENSGANAINAKQIVQARKYHFQRRLTIMALTLLREFSNDAVFQILSTKLENDVRAVRDKTLNITISEMIAGRITKNGR